MRSAPETFARKVEAQRYLTLLESQITRGEWIDPARAEVTVGDYADRWISERAGLRPRTVELYRWLLRRHIDPWIGDVPLGKLDTPLGDLDLDACGCGGRSWRCGVRAWWPGHPSRPPDRLGPAAGH